MLCSSNDEALVYSLKALEDRIEQRYLVNELTLSLAAIAELTESAPALSKEFNHLSPKFLPEADEMSKAMELILQDAPEPTQFERDRDTIWRLVSEYGKPAVLMFISPRLMLNLEVFFAGIVVGYIRMFNESNGRSRLDYKRVFSDHDDLKSIHEEMVNLRNKQYAHNELSDGRHHLGYRVDNHGDITIDVDGPQNSRHYHLEMLHHLRQCLSQVAVYLHADIAARSEKIRGKLSDSQKDFLRTYTG